jgi:NAD+ diphosphatase
MLTQLKNRPLVFTGGPLDRASELRTDAEWLRTKRAEDQAMILPLWRLQPLLLGAEGTAESGLYFLTAGEAAKLHDDGAQEVFLGLNGDAGVFARDISGEEEPLSRVPGPAHFRDARSALEVIPLEETAILGQAKALLDWHARHRFCSACGAPTVSVDAGYRRECPSCKANHFPRTDPAVIMLVTSGDKCLLARNKRFGVTHNHSVLAGFVEPGEAIEECVRREVFEEVGIRVGNVRYVATQPWPFPSNLMIGCIAEALSDEIRVDGNEIVSARWFEKKIIARMLAGEPIEDVRLPRPIAIAFHLIRTWVEE